MVDVRIVQGDSLEVLRELPEGSIDSVVCDPPYGLEFMGREWDSFRPDESRVSKRWDGERAGAQGSLKPRSDAGEGSLPTPSYGGQRPTTSRCSGCGRRDAFRNVHACAPETPWEREVVTANAAPPAMLAFQEWTRQWALAAYRALKPGGHLLAFGGTRTYHRLAAGLEDAGFEVRDTLAWIYGSGFPKSLDVSKALDKAAGAVRTDREVAAPAGNKVFQPTQTVVNAGTPVTEEAQRWQGWGTALKPAHEPVVVARKPLGGTVAANVRAHGTGALNVDATRVGETKRVPGSLPQTTERDRGAGWGFGDRDPAAAGSDPNVGRWPPNVLLGCTCDEVVLGVPATVTERADDRRYTDEGVTNFAATPGRLVRSGEVPDVHTDPGCPAAIMDAQGDSSRFFPRFPLEDPDAEPVRFLYQAKTSKREREAGLDQLDEGTLHRTNAGGYEADPKWAPTARKNTHPTVKPKELMRWLVRLVTPPGGTVLDPFLGSGSTGIAAATEGFDFVGVEREAEFVDIAVARIAHWAPDALLTVERPAAEEPEPTEADALAALPLGEFLEVYRPVHEAAVAADWAAEVTAYHDAETEVS